MSFWHWPAALMMQWSVCFRIASLSLKIPQLQSSHVMPGQLHFRVWFRGTSSEHRLTKKAKNQLVLNQDFQIRYILLAQRCPKPQEVKVWGPKISCMARIEPWFITKLPAHSEFFSNLKIWPLEHWCIVSHLKLQIKDQLILASERVQQQL